MRWVTLVTNNDGGRGAIIHPDLAAAKQAVRDYLCNPELNPPQTPHERERMESHLRDIREDDVYGGTGISCHSVSGSDAWKEWVYVAVLEEDAVTLKPAFDAQEPQLPPPVVKDSPTFVDCVWFDNRKNERPLDIDIGTGSLT